eukprot:CAMPEP_0114613854 /NCGR_PEP_ID=MMETSP0168-20121206/5349_1 /TAXON_ID=95228 ORGANISM="Vannella sp., Strain DIVA3 517/6/12" /NCGR_SAMPLE_ID=MMETSP0168 /ASSEMBLY_ACC=CAM_ASM_000044 /LENGTH=367 /DNA_ID=CAMNT_0001824877 /DNA_START=26 /DNA_END=1126 /DNA_ORIENTATION=+
MSETPLVAVLISGLSGVEAGLRDTWDGEEDLQARTKLAIAKTGWEEQNVTPEELETIKNADILVGDPPLLAACIRTLHSKAMSFERLRWIHCTWAGPDALIKALQELDGKIQLGPGGGLPRLTRSVGQRMRGDLAAFVVGRIVEQERFFVHSRRQQALATWDQQAVRDYRCLRDLTVGVLGVGQIGTAVANAAAFFGMRVIGINTKGEPPSAAIEEAAKQTTMPGMRKAMVSPALLQSSIDAWYPVSRLQEALPECDYLVSILPSLPSTRGLLNGTVLEAAKGRTTLINIGRGDLIDEPSLLEALDKSWLAGAVLDVHYVEPLPAASRLWHHERVTISPHVGSVSSAKDIVAAFRTEMGLLLRNEPV